MDPQEPNTQLAAIVKENDIAIEIGMPIVTAFQPHFEAASKLAEDAKAINVTDATQVSEIALARKTRLAMRDARIASTKVKDREKEKYLRMGKAIQGIHNKVLAIAEPVETRLQEMEDFAERADSARIEALRVARDKQLQAFGVDTSSYILGTMKEDAFRLLLNATKTAYEAKIEAEREAEEARIQAEKDRREEEVRIRAENERLRKEAEAKEVEAKAERERLANEAREREAVELAERQRIQREADTLLAKEREAARKAKEEVEAKVKIERLAAEAAAKNEREAREAVERELQAKRDAEAAKAAAEDKRLALEEEARKAAARAPDKEKLAALVAVLRGIKMPSVSSPEAEGFILRTRNAINTIAQKLSDELKSL